ncbi:MAG: hypothetical protein WC249_02035 [Patescibacteria group bacterium]|jgi:hypothetical protein
MPREKNLENPLIEKIEKTVAKVEKINVQEDRIQSAVLAPEKTSKSLELPKKSIKLPPVAPAPLSDFQKKRAAAIDDILAAGLNEVFLQMKTSDQQAFQKKGEETVIKINELLNKTKVKVSKIIDLIRAWLKLIPGINRFFLEQEVKIKADKILKLKDKF